MSLNRFCPKCKTSYKINKRKCKHCKLPLTQFRVRTTNLDGRTVSKVCHSLPDAKQAEIDLRNLHSESQLTLNQAYKKYIEYAKNKKVSWRDDRQRYLTYVKGWLGEYQMPRIKPTDVQAILDSMFEKAPSTRKQVFQLISRLFNWSSKMQLYNGSNPCRALELPKLNNERVRYLSPDELKRFHAVLDGWENERAVLPIKFLLFSGKRRSEVLGLRWSHVDLGGGYITLLKPKAGQKQILPINKTCQQILQRAYEIKISNWVFPSNTGNNYTTTLKSIWPAMMRKAEITDFRMHDLRHTYASMLISSGKVDIYTLQQLLGHKTLAMTQRYAHLIPGKLREASEVADSVLQVPGS